jgi:hypothetical protein
VISSRNVFDGYQYTHAVLARFDAVGEMRWDQIFEMSPWSKPYYVKRFVSIASGTANAINMAFVDGNKFVSKSFALDGALNSSKHSDEIDTGQKGDRSRWASTDMSHWYEHYFIVCGTQRIKNDEEDAVKANKGKKKRDVFFVNKIGYK